MGKSLACEADTEQCHYLLRPLPVYRGFGRTRTLKIVLCNCAQTFRRMCPVWTMGVFPKRARFSRIPNCAVCRLRTTHGNDCRRLRQRPRAGLTSSLPSAHLAVRARSPTWANRMQVRSIQKSESRFTGMSRSVPGTTTYYVQYSALIHYGSTGGARIRDGVRSMNSESEYRIPIQSFMRDSFD